MTSRRLFGLGCLLTTAALTAASCNPDPPPPPARRPIVVIVDDVSGSSKEPNAGLARQVVAGALDQALGQSGKVVVVALTGDTAGDFDMPVVADFAPQGDLPNDLFKGAVRQTDRDRALRDYDGWRSSVPAALGRSDYLGALVVVGRLLAAWPGPKQVVLVGDGLQATPEWNMYEDRPTADSCRARAEARRRDGTLGALAGADVLVVGGGRNARQLLTSAQQLDLQACWQAILTMAGAVTGPGWWNGDRYVTSARR
jgi:hypothetical protein